MATKHFCDGCGKEQEIRNLTQVTVSWPRNSMSNKEFKFDLDEPCLQEFVSKFPGGWPRVAEPSYSHTPSMEKMPMATLDEDIPF